MTAEEVAAYLADVFPQLEPIYRVESVGPLTGRLAMSVDHRHLRPGGTVSGPSLMALADLAFYVTLLAQIGPVALAVTTNLSFNFLRKPEPRELMAECRLLKLGRRLAVGEVSITNAGSTAVACHATGTYSIPPL